MARPTGPRPSVRAAALGDVHYFKQMKQGPAAARNRGRPRHASGDYVAFWTWTICGPRHVTHSPDGRALRAGRGWTWCALLQVHGVRPRHRNLRILAAIPRSRSRTASRAVYCKRVFDRVGLFDQDADVWRGTPIEYNRARASWRCPLHRVEAITLHRAAPRRERDAHAKTLVESLNVLLGSSEEGGLDRRRTGAAHRRRTARPPARDPTPGGARWRRPSATPRGPVISVTRGATWRDHRTVITSAACWLPVTARLCRRQRSGS